MEPKEVVMGPAPPYWDLFQVPQILHAKEWVVGRRHVLAWGPGNSQHPVPPHWDSCWSVLPNEARVGIGSSASSQCGGTGNKVFPRYYATSCLHVTLCQDLSQPLPPCEIWISIRPKSWHGIEGLWGMQGVFGQMEYITHCPVLGPCLMREHEWCMFFLIKRINCDFGDGCFYQERWTCPFTFLWVDVNWQVCHSSFKKTSTAVVFSMQ